MSALVIRGDARRLPLPDATVDLVVTSPPFLNLRSYQDGGQHYAGQIGTGSRDEFLEELWAVTAECARVLKPQGSIFVELGDSYTDKSLNMSPHRYAIGCTDMLGLLLRAELVWDRPNGLPESVTDRVRRSHSVWFHLVKQPRYYSAVDEIREPHVALEHYNRYGKGPKSTKVDPSRMDADRQDKQWLGDPNPLGKLPGSVWEISTEPLIVPDHISHARCCAGRKRPGCEDGLEHFAAYPIEWPRRLILGWSPPGICGQCGQGRRPVADIRYLSQGDRFAGGTLLASRHRSGIRMGDGSLVNITGYACACTPYIDHPGTGQGGWGSYDDAGVAGAPSANGKQHVPGNYKPRTGPWREYHFDQWTPHETAPAVILDPFGGTGTTALVASALGRVGISVDLSHDYSRLAAWRTSDPAQRAKAMRVSKPPVQVTGQADLFTGHDGEAG